MSESDKIRAEIQKIANTDFVRSIALAAINNSAPETPVDIADIEGDNGFTRVRRERELRRQDG